MHLRFYLGSQMTILTFLNLIPMDFKYDNFQCSFFESQHISIPMMEFLILLMLCVSFTKDSCIKILPVQPT